MLKNKSNQIDWTLIKILLLGLFLRIFILDIRTPDYDEGIYGLLSISLKKIVYFNPNYENYNNTLYNLVLYFSQKILGNNIWTLRLPSAIISTLTIACIYLFLPFLGRGICLISTFAMAISPAFVYYGRYAIPESFIVFFNILILWGIIGFWNTKIRKYLIVIILGICGLVFTTKTFLSYLLCFALSGILFYLLDKFLPSHKEINKKYKLPLVEIFIFIIIYILFIGSFHTKVFFEEWYIKNFLHWIKLFFRYEQIALVGFFFGLRYLLLSSKWIRYVLLYGFLSLFFYSFNSSIKPFHIINLLWPFYFAFGEIIIRFLKPVEELENQDPPKYLIKLFWPIYFIFGEIVDQRFLKTLKQVLTFTIGLILCILSAYFTFDLNYINHSNPIHPYVIQSISSDIEKLIQPIYRLTKKDLLKQNIVGHIFCTDPIPLPWIFNDFPKISFYNSSSLPKTFDADFLLIEDNKINDTEQKLQKDYLIDYMKLKNNMNLVKIYFNYDLFQNILPFHKSEEFVPLEQGKGLLACFYSNTGWEGINSRLKRKPDFLKQFGKIDFEMYDPRSWDSSLKPNLPFAIEFIGEIYIPKNNLTLTLATDDGGFLEVDGDRIIEDPGPHGYQLTSGTIVNKIGWRKIKIGSYNINNNIIVRLMWNLENDDVQIVPSKAFRFDKSLLTIH